jgi:hypothetical protein
MKILDQLEASARERAEEEARADVRFSASTWLRISHMRRRTDLSERGKAWHDFALRSVERIMWAALAFAMSGDPAVFAGLLGASQ